MAYRRSPVYEVVGDVMGDVMGEPFYEVGENPAPAPAPGSWRMGPQRTPASNIPTTDPRLMFQPPRPGSPNANMTRIVVNRPEWRDGQLAPGVMAPDEGMVPLGMTPDNGTGIFAAAGPTKITWTGRLQKPYRAERLLVSSVRTGASATGRLLGQFFVGVDLNMATLQPVDIELYGAATAFGTRLTLLQAPPGVELGVPVSLSALPTGTDTVFATVQWSGRIVH